MAQIKKLGLPTKERKALLDKKIDVIPLSKILNKVGFPENWYEIETID